MGLLRELMHNEHIPIFLSPKIQQVCAIEIAKSVVLGSRLVLLSQSAANPRTNLPDVRQNKWVVFNPSIVPSSNIFSDHRTGRVERFRDEKGCRRGLCCRCWGWWSRGGRRSLITPARRRGLVRRNKTPLAGLGVGGRWRGSHT